MAQPGPAFSVHDVYAGWVEALRELGQHVLEFNLGDRLTFYGSVLVDVDGEYRPALDGHAATELAVNGLYAALYKARPDVLLVVSGFFLPPEVYKRARDAGTRVVVLHTEAPYEAHRQIGVAQHADVNLLNDPTGIEQYPRAHYVPHAYRPSVHHPGPGLDRLRCDVGFCGTGFPSRIAFFEAMDLDGLDVALAGNWQALPDGSPLWRHVANAADECVDNTETAELYRSARLGLNLYRREAQAPELVDGWAMGPREVEMAACGLFFLRDPRPEGDELLDMLPTFTTPAEASELARWWLAHPDQRASAAGRARAALAGRTFHTHAAALLRLLDG